MHLKGEPLSFKELNATLRSLPATIKLAVLDACKSGAVTRKGGTRSALATRDLLDAGFTRVWSVSGGLLRWSREVDSDVPEY